jgi:succinoglycan biosynthesis protein ExoA
MTTRATPVTTSSPDPVVTVVIPMYDEAGYIEPCLEAFAAQTWPHDLLDVVVVDGRSGDGCRQTVESLAVDHSWLRVLDNPARRIPAACNIGLHAAKGDIVCFFSSHGVPSPTYVERTVAVMRETGATGVGGTYDHVGLDSRSSAIGLAMASPFGMASPHRFATARRDVDTISHPAYRIDPVLAVGGFNEELQRNEDYELNWRLRQAGARLVFDPSITSTYRPRRSLSGLSRQFWHYGWWKARVVGRHHGSFKARHMVPPAAVVAAMVAPALAVTARGRVVVGMGAAGYAAVVAAGVAHAHPRRHHASPLAMAVAFPTMHVSWGAGFAASAAAGAAGRLRVRLRPRSRRHAAQAA